MRVVRERILDTKRQAIEAEAEGRRRFAEAQTRRVAALPDWRVTCRACGRVRTGTLAQVRQGCGCDGR